MIRRARSILLAVPILLAPLALAGCSANPGSTDSDVQWGTRERIANEPNRGLRRLEVEEIAPEEIESVRSAAIGLLRQATGSTNPLLRANALEALQIVPEELDGPLRAALRDENRGVRFVAAMTVGELKLARHTAAVEPLLADPSASVQAAAIFALRRCGRSVDLSPLGGMIVSDDLEVRGNAALVLGKLGDPAALPLLRDAVRRTAVRGSVADNRRVELQIAEAMYWLGRQETDLQVIRAALFTPREQGEITVLACQMMGELDDQAYRSALIDKAMRSGQRQEPAEIRIAAAAAVARMTPHEAPIEPVLGYVGSDNFAIRAQAAHALGWFRDREVRPTLMTMMNDPNALVQVAAAGAVLRAFS